MKTNKQMTDEVLREVQKHKIKSKTLTTVISVLAVFICLAVVSGASARYKVFSPEWRDGLIDKASQTPESEDVNEFREKLALSNDRFSKDKEYQVLMDYDREINIGISQQGGEYIFNLRSIVPGQWLRNTVVSGSLADIASLEFEWKVTDAWFAIIETVRADGTDMTDEDTFFHWLRFATGYNPFRMNMCMEGTGEFSVLEDGKRWTAVVITDMMMFADNDFIFIPSDLDAPFSLTNEYVYADKEGNFEIKESSPDTAVFLRCKIDDSFADKRAQENFKKDRFLDSFIEYEK